MSVAIRRQPLGSNDVELTPMRRRHVRQVMRIESQVYLRPWSAALFLQEIARRADRFYIVARKEASVVGYGGLMTSGLESHITTIAVDPVHQGQHIGLKLMLCLVTAAVDRGAQTISLEVRKSNLGAQRLYELFGFQPVGVRRGYYIETGEDAIVMWVDGVDTPRYVALLETLRSRAGEESGGGST